jgi:hypothetical protein
VISLEGDVWTHKTSSNLATFYEVPVSGNGTVMYLCSRGIYFVCCYEFSIGLRKCSDSEVFFFLFHFILKWYGHRNLSWHLQLINVTKTNMNVSSAWSPLYLYASENCANLTETDRNESELEMHSLTPIHVMIKICLVYSIRTYGKLNNQWLLPLTLWVRIPLIVRCTRHNILWWSLSVICGRSMDLFGFLHQ